MGKSSQACASRVNFTFLFVGFFLSPNFHELWHNVMSTCIITEVKQQWTLLVIGWVTA